MSKYSRCIVTKQTYYQTYSAILVAVHNRKFHGRKEIPNDKDSCRNPRNRIN